MHVILVCGSRDFPTTDRHRLDAHLDAWLSATDGPAVLMAGGAHGPDSWGEAWAKRNGVHVLRMDALWKAHGRGAGPQRNRMMAEVLATLATGHATVAGVACWDGRSRGTKHMIRLLEGYAYDPTVLTPSH